MSGKKIACWLRTIHRNGEAPKKVGAGFARNPVPDSNYKGSREADIDDAARLYKQFTGHESKYVDKMGISWPSVVTKVGDCLGVMYETVRDGQKERYLHRFAKHARPALCASHDGSSIHMIGGSYDFTDRGIVDRKK